MRRRLVLGTLVWVLATAAAFLLLDPIVGAAVAIFGGALVALAVAAADWDRHSSYEEREMERTLRRKEKWAGRADARARDRAKWEAYQARQAEKARKAGSGGDAAR